MATDLFKTHTQSIDYQKLFDQLPERYIVVSPDDPNFTIIAENKAHTVVTLAKKHSVGLPFLDAFSDVTDEYIRSDVSSLIESFRRVKSTGRPDTVSILRYDVNKVDGTTAQRYWQITNSPLFVSSGKERRLEAILQSAVDLTEHKQVENNLSYLAKAGAVLAASLDYHTTFQSIAELLVPEIADWCTVDILNDDDELELVAVAHKDPAKVIWGRKLREVQGPPDLTKTDSGMGKVIRKGAIEYYPLVTEEMIVTSTTTEAELTLLRELSLTSIIIVPISVGGKPIGAITMISTDLKRTFTQSDVEMASELANRASLAIHNARLYDEAQHELQERTRLEEELRLINEELEHRVEVRTNELEQLNISLQRSNQELQDFAYVASHDLQEPLRKIQAFGNLLETEYAKELSGAGEDYLRRMRNAAARMSSLIEDILSFSRVTTKGREFTLVDLHTVAKEVIDDLEVRIKETNASVTVGKLPSIHADAMQMRQLLQNLVANAIKFHRPDIDPVITIKARAERSAGDKSKFCLLEISDNGLGFEEKYLDRIFAVFQRLHNRDTYEGTGIGLAVCRKIVERHGGTITAKSKPGKGSKFIVRLPLRHKKGENLS